MLDKLPLCCVCAKEIDGEVAMTSDARAHHPACRPLDETEIAQQGRTQSLSDFAERKARNAMHGRGQRQLGDN